MIKLRCIITTLCLLLSLVTITAEGQPNTIDMQGDGTLRRIPVPILMYHYVSEIPEDADGIRINLTVTPGIFRDHMDYLAINNYETVSLYEIHDALEHGATLPQKSVALTFDDSYIDHYRHVFPILRDRGQMGTFFVITQFVDDRHRGYLSWQKVREMADAGMHMEAHTKTHPSLMERSYEFLVYEIIGSVESLEYHIDWQPRMFAYPAGRYDTNTLAVMKSTNLARAVTTQPGYYQTTSNDFEMPRIRISNDVQVPGLAHLLNQVPLR